LERRDLHAHFELPNNLPSGVVAFLSLKYLSADLILNAPPPPSDKFWESKGHLKILKT